MMNPFRSILSLLVLLGFTCAVSAKHVDRIFAGGVLDDPTVQLTTPTPRSTFTLTTPAGTQSWTYNAFGGVESWTVGGVQQFMVTDLDLLGRPLEIEDTSGTREIRYDNDKWTLDTMEWTAGPLQGFKLDEDADTRGRLGTLTVSKGLDDLYSVTHAYRGESDRIDTMTITATGAPSVILDINGPGGVADEFVYTVNGQNTYTYSRSRNGDGRLTGITAPGFSQSWTLDAMGRVDVLTTNGKPTDYGYNPVNGSLASAVSPDEARFYTFTDRGELEEEVINGETLWAAIAADQSGAIAGRENLRELKIYGSFHTNAVVNVLVGTNVVHNTAVTPFEFTFDAGTIPALANTNAVVSLDWSVVGTRPEEPGGTDYEGDFARSEVAGNHLFAPQAETVTYDIATRRSSDAFLTYGWNAANQALMFEERHGPHRTEHEYDGSQRRVEKRVYHHGNLRRTHRFVYDGWLPVVEEVTDKWGNLDYRNLYVYGPGPDGARRPGLGTTGQLALIIHQPKFGPPQLSAPVYNHRLDLVSLVDVETGNVVARYGYTPFGETTYAVGSRAEQNPFRFAGAYFDTEVNLYAFGYRYYDPRTKSWLSRDPIGEAGGLNLFIYCSGEPVSKGPDYLGHSPISSGEYAELIRQPSPSLPSKPDPIPDQSWIDNFSLANVSLPHTYSPTRRKASREVEEPKLTFREKWQNFRMEWYNANPRAEYDRLVAEKQMEAYWAARSERGFWGNRADDWDAYWDWAGDHKIQAVISWYTMFRLVKPGPRTSYAGSQPRAVTGNSQSSLRIRSSTTTNPQYLPVVYDPAFAQAQLGNISWLDLYLYRSSTPGIFTYRGDTRGFNMIFNEGFSARGTSQDLFSHAVDNWNPPSAYVSTTTSPSVAASFGDDLNIYIVRPRNGLDVNYILGPRSPYPHELEIAVPWSIRPFDIRGVTLPQEGVSILNPNWIP